MESDKTIINEAITYLKTDKLKEWSCHVQFVLELATKYQIKYWWDELVVKLSAILHDIWRGRELEWEHHNITWVREWLEFLGKYDIEQERIEKILQCIRNHWWEQLPRMIEEKIIITADSISKLEQHECFVLMTKKESTLDRARRWLKYIEKGYRRICLEAEKEIYHSLYLTKKTYYESVIREIQNWIWE